jgi:polysaccharide pyruvyl transferase WcaK-like protein
MSYQRILLLMDNRNDSNWGSQATTSELVRLLQRHHPGAEVRGLPRSVTRPKNALLRRFAECAAPPAVQWGTAGTGLGAEAVRLLTGPWRAAVEWADLIVVNGEGTLHPQKQASRWLAALAEIGRSEKPIWIVNCSVQFVGDSNELLYKSVLERVQRLVVREPVSYRELAGCGLKADLGADCAFCAEPISTETLENLVPNQPFAAMTGSAAVKRWPIPAQVGIVEHLADLGLKAVYLSSTEEDEHNHRLLSQEIEIPLVTHRELGFREVIELISRSQLLVGGRFHPIVFAAICGTPFVAVESTTPKMAGLVEMLESRDMLFELDDLAGQRAAARRALVERTKIRSTLRRLASVYASRAEINAMEGAPEPRSS